MVENNDILEGARSIRPYLEDLLGPNAGQVDNELSSLLESAQSGQQVEREILELVDQHEPTHNWMDDFLEHNLPPNVVNELFRLLESAQSGQAYSQALIRDLVNTNQQWMDDFLEHNLPPNVLEEIRVAAAYQPLPGSANPPGPVRYVCPVGGDYTWFRRSAGQQVPLCRTHGVPLIRG